MKPIPWSRVFFILALFIPSLPPSVPRELQNLVAQMDQATPVSSTVMPAL